MPELPDITLYIEALRERILGRRLERSRVLSPFLLRSVEPPMEAVHAARVAAFERLGKRIAIGFDNDVWLVLHLMIAGRLHWRADWPTSFTRQAALALKFENGTLLLTEAGKKKRASLHVFEGRAGLALHQPGGIEIDRVTAEEFEAVLKRRNHTLKRALTDPRLISGIGNAYSDEILHAAKMSPYALAASLTDDDIDRLYAATIDTLTEATEAASGRPPADLKDAKRRGMQVHGRRGETCPVCGDEVRSVFFADNSLEYCPTCQTGGKILADRRLSRLLK